MVVAGKCVRVNGGDSGSTELVSWGMTRAMSKLLIALIAIVGLIVAVALGAIGTYNGLVGKQQGVDAAWAQVLNQYQRRSDLVPNLVKTVQGSANFEQSTLKQVVEARASVGRITIDANKAPADMATMQKFQDAQGQFGGALQRLLVVSEKYPDLKASEGFRDLQTQLEGTENRIAVERMRYNDAAKEFNTKRRMFPASIIANSSGFQEKAYFEADEGAEKAPKVKFN